MTAHDPGFLEELKSSALERMKSPIAGTFAIIWLLTNWRVPVALAFGSVPEQGRIELLEQVFSQENEFDLWLKVALIPLAVTFLYLTIMPALREAYAGWLIQSEYRTTRRRQQLEQDLREESEYRETLRAICAALRRELVDSEKAFSKIAEFAKAGLDPSSGEFYSQIESTAIRRKKSLEITNRHFDFFGHYTGELPSAYESFLMKWRRTMPVITGLPPKSSRYSLIDESKI